MDFAHGCALSSCPHGTIYRPEEKLKTCCEIQRWTLVCFRMISRRVPVGRPADLPRFWFNRPGAPGRWRTVPACRSALVADLKYQRLTSAISRPAPCTRPAQHKAPPAIITDARIKIGQRSVSPRLSSAAEHAAQAPAQCRARGDTAGVAAFSLCCLVIVIRIRPDRRAVRRGTPSPGEQP